jgi:pyridoxamine 5'-phosphate oxidase
MVTSRELQHLRKSYEGRALEDAHALAGPFTLFEQWMREAIEVQTAEPNAMALATASPGGYPCSRMVLLRNFDSRGFVFYTNYASEKALHIAANPKVALTFWWKELDRQVRIEGRAAKVSATESDAYFRSRPRGHQLSAWASPQSTPVPSRHDLELREQAAAARFEGKDVPRPKFWGGYRVKPVRFEFWQGRPNRLHDRIEFRLRGRKWLPQRLAP